jgi:hypothetical protein
MVIFVIKKFNYQRGLKMNNEAPQFFLVSRKLFGYLDAKTGSIKRIEYNGVALVADKRQWVKEYITLVPPELDCILAGSAIYDTANKLIYFELDRYQFELPNVKAVSTYLTQLPEKLQKPGRKLFWETLLSVVLIESKAFDQYELIHHNRRLRLFLSEANVRCANPLLMYDFKSKFQKEVEAAASFARLDLF